MTNGALPPPDDGPKGEFGVAMASIVVLAIFLILVLFSVLAHAAGLSMDCAKAGRYAEKIAGDVAQGFNMTDISGWRLKQNREPSAELHMALVMVIQRQIADPAKAKAVVMEECRRNQDIQIIPAGVETGT